MAEDAPQAVAGNEVGGRQPDLALGCFHPRVKNRAKAQSPQRVLCHHSRLARAGFENTCDRHGPNRSVPEVIEGVGSLLDERSSHPEHGFPSRCLGKSRPPRVGDANPADPGSPVIDYDDSPVGSVNDPLDSAKKNRGNLHRVIENLQSDSRRLEPLFGFASCQQRPDAVDVDSYLHPSLGGKNEPV